jgi:hypothetical protein
LKRPGVAKFLNNEYAARGNTAGELIGNMSNLGVRFALAAPGQRGGLQRPLQGAGRLRLGPDAEAIQSGVKGWFQSDRSAPPTQRRLPDLGKSLTDVRLGRPIGSKFDYSNLGAGLLGHALVNAAKAEKYEDLLARRLTSTIEMKDTTITLTPEQRDRFPLCYNTKGMETPPWEFGCLEGRRIEPPFATTDRRETMAQAYKKIVLSIPVESPDGQVIVSVSAEYSLAGDNLNIPDPRDQGEPGPT